MPKRPSTAWGLFFVEHLDKVRASGKPVVPTTETVIASAQWKQLSDAQKQVSIVFLQWIYISGFAIIS
jgi:hypothetical protein